MPPHRLRFCLTLTALLSAVAGCGGPFPQSTLAPKSDYSTAVDQLFTDIFWWAVVVFVIVEGLLLFVIIRYRRREGAGEPKALHGHTALEIGWTLAPALILVFIAVPTMRTIFATAGRAPEGALRVEVIGHQWWWEYRYPALGIVTANELHLPVGTPILLEMTSADVIHSFWAPGLGGKRDLTQGRTTRIAFRADSTGEYWGQCAEFCGASHANMRLRVFVEPDSAFRAWAARQTGAPAPPARGSVAERGRQVFARSACLGCHTIEGVSRGAIGPNLTHVASRTTLAGALFPNTADHLRRWIANAPSLKPGAQMPPQALPEEDLAALVAYLESLR
ncbi:MAG TPA: cytochrome c oxidase subunit II [Gemmatimonadales bacterium]|nr:cytochrome c oxidase subunit II [Gemmatimonadales bacterium]